MSGRGKGAARGARRRRLAHRPLPCEAPRPRLPSRVPAPPPVSYYAESDPPRPAEPPNREVTYGGLGAIDAIALAFIGAAIGAMLLAAALR